MGDGYRVLFTEMFWTRPASSDPSGNENGSCSTDDFEASDDDDSISWEDSFSILCRPVILVVVVLVVVVERKNGT
jgi:hypothetical protein